ncbi:MAG: hypothetical protein AAB897_02655 [Patescibacteria group bacterium]
MFLPKSKKLHWTFHARAKMGFYKLSEQRVRHVLNSPKRVEEGIAPKTMAMMQPASVKTSAGRPGTGKEETWNHEIWVMLQDEKSRRKIISAWRYPGRTKPRSETVIEGIKAAYNEYMKSAK